MNKHLLVVLLMIGASTILTACSGGSQIDTNAQRSGSAPVEMEVVSAPKSEAAAAHNELLDPEFGCNGGGSLEYGVVQRPKKN